MTALDLDHLYIGIDNTRPNCLRVVCLDDGWDGSGPLWFSRFRNSTRFQLSLEPFLGAGTVIATTTRAADPFGGIAWLADLGYEVQRFDKRLMSGFGGLSPVGTFAKYRPAYQLAQQARRVSSAMSG